MVQRGHAFAIVDEVDSILVDEARTPLIISGPSDDRSELYNSVNALIPRLRATDYDLDEKQRTVNLTEAGNEHAEELLREAGLLKEGSLYEAANVTLVHHVNQALRAHKLFQRDKDYIVRNGEVVIVDEFTGRMMPGRRYSEGLHQALEAKEHVQVQPENVTLASITFQNYFRLYKKLAGMTGTAATEADEFAEIYKLEVVEIPTHRPVSVSTKTTRSIAPASKSCAPWCARSRPPTPTCSRCWSARPRSRNPSSWAEVLEKAGYRRSTSPSPGAAKPLYAAARAGKPSKHFAILNARFHEQEAYHRRRGGRAGRDHHRHQYGGPRHRHSARRQCRDARRRNSTRERPPRNARSAQEAAIRAEVEDFKQKAIAAGGLYIIGTERHESRRIDNQLRGRSPAGRAIRAARSSSCRCRTT
jgi:preprotein translocase subunit SecA